MFSSMDCIMYKSTFNAITVYTYNFGENHNTMANKRDATGVTIVKINISRFTVLESFKHTSKAHSLW